MSKFFLAVLSLFIMISSNFVQTGDKYRIYEFKLEDAKNLELINVKAKPAVHADKTGLRVTKSAGHENEETLVIIPDIEFTNGIIEVELSGEAAPNENPNMRGFVGIAFRLQKKEHYNYECFYLRPANGRADNQLRRNHSVQYTSHPDYPWYKLRKESPEMYESYVDLQPGVWTKMKIVVSGEKAKLYLHDSDQPSLIVNDLKKGVSKGKIALWLHSSTLAHFRNLTVKPDIEK
jgi:hypothetical protein